MRRAVLATMAVLLRAGTALGQQPQRRPPPAGWTYAADEVFDGLRAAGARNGFRSGLLDRGCGGPNWVECDLDLRGVPIRMRGRLGDLLIVEAGMTLPATVPAANRAAALRTLILWAGPQAASSAVQDVAQAVMQASAPVARAIGRTQIDATPVPAGIAVVARPLS